MERKYKVRSIDIWDDERDPILMGVIKGTEDIQVGKEQRQTMIIDTGLAQVRVWHSKALEDAFKLGKPGDGIRIEYKGKIPLTGGKTFRRVSVQVWENGNLEEIQREQESDTGAVTS